MKIIKFCSLLMVIMIVACNEKKKNENVEKSEKSSNEKMEAKNFQDTVKGKIGVLKKIENGDITAYFTNYGARLVGLWTPDKDGNPTDVVVGFGDLNSYVKSTEPYFGATIGRYGNRIAKGKFSLDGEEYDLSVNNGANTLHGGKKGFQSKFWNVEQPDDHTLVFTYTSKDGEQGFPGNLKTKVTYSLTNDNRLKMEYEATTDKKTVVNMTNHAFFNLNGEGSGTVLNHKVMINAANYTPVDSTLIPLGKMASVEDTPFDFQEATTIGERIDEDNEQLKNGKGYDHNFVLQTNDAEGMTHAASVVGDKSGIQMDIYTEEPGLQFYSGNFMKGKNTFKNGSKDEYRTAFAMETQHYPDSPNQSDYPSTVLNPGETYHTVSVYEFSVEETE